MITVAEALDRVLQRARPRAAEFLATAEARGCVVARQIECTIDSPPYDKSLVDGYAVRDEDLAAGAELQVLEQVTAGQTPSQPLTPGSAIRIMTGAPIPVNAGAVVMVEQTETFVEPGGSERVRLHTGSFRPGQNIMRRGEAMRHGEPVLLPGHRLRAIEIGLLAELGVTQVSVYPVPRVAILATGDELVGSDQTPAAGQIRNCNGPMLRELVFQAQGVPCELGIARDNEHDLKQLICAGLEQDVLLLSGGVSAGVLDLVPQVLRDLGVVEVFHKVNLRPGKPLWFGVTPGGPDRSKLVFGLPGNPVSGLVCFHLFVRPALAALAGDPSPNREQFAAKLAREHHHRSDRPTYHPGRASEQDGHWQVEPLAWHGSADLRTFGDANVLIYFPGHPRIFAAGEHVLAHWL